jgi:hypothetical protein
LRSNFQIDQDQANTILREIISDIQSTSNNCTWFLSSDRLISILNIKRDVYYKTLYSLKNKEFNPSTYKGFFDTDGEYLCLLLKDLLKLDFIEDEFSKNGIFFSEEKLGILRNSLPTYLEKWFQKHKLDKDLLILLASSTLKFDDAFDSYVNDKMNIETLVERTVENFIEDNSINPFFGSEEYLKKYLHSQIIHKKISFKKVHEEFKDRYYYELFRVDRKKTSQPKKLTREHRELLNFFQLDEFSDRKNLKEKYKELLKKFHPDINKDGLEKTKLIILKYKKLYSIMES